MITNVQPQHAVIGSRTRATFLNKNKGGKFLNCGAVYVGERLLDNLVSSTEFIS